MNPFNAFVLFMVIWWIILFMVLPFGVRGQLEDNDVVPGSEPGAPTKSLIKKKLLITTALAVLTFGIVYCIIVFDLFNIADLPFIPKIT
ncbi:DUF1467 family protein [Robiginitomaculum antarcticum]|uniref:DUF1467 family protein n=1 Tax=Robiginitomaculum antarcticum TaxID=437507 RepID=UPI00037EF7E0|nr:DUF1467 family protein [Robiginitomaculum antarcticum]